MWIRNQFVRMTIPRPKNIQSKSNIVVKNYRYFFPIDCPPLKKKTIYSIYTKHFNKVGYMFKPPVVFAILKKPKLVHLQKPSESKKSIMYTLFLLSICWWHFVSVICLLLGYMCKSLLVFDILKGTQNDTFPKILWIWKVDYVDTFFEQRLLMTFGFLIFFYWVTCATLLKFSAHWRESRMIHFQKSDNFLRSICWWHFVSVI